MEASAARTTTTGRAAHASRMAARSPLVRLQSDEKLVALVRRGNDHAFETLVSRYSARLSAFCRHMLGSSEDAEDVLQEVFAAAYGAMNADDRPIAVRPWLYRIARNRSLNHIRRAKPIGQDDMDLHLAEHGASTADQAHRRMEFAVLLDDVGRLVETQRTALVLREMEHLSYDQIAQAMDTTVPAVKSLLVRARMGLAEASEARALSCEDVRLDLGAAAEGLAKLTPAVRRHLKECDRCDSFQRHLRHTNRALAAVLPIGPLFVLKQFFLAHLGGAAAGGSASSGGAAAAGAGWAGAAAGSSSAGGLLSAVTGAVGTKAAAGLAAAALVGGGAVEVQHLSHAAPASHPAAVASAPAPSPVVTHHAVPRAAPAVAARSAALARAAATRAAQPVRHPKPRAPREAKAPAPAPKPAPAPLAATPVTPAPSAPPTVNSPVPVPPTAPETQPAAPVTPTVSDTTVLPAPPAPPGTDAPTGDPTPSNPPPPAGPAVPLPPSNVFPAPPPPPPGDVGR